MQRTLATAFDATRTCGPVTPLIDSDSEINEWFIMKSTQPSELDTWDNTTPVWTPFRH